MAVERERAGGGFESHSGDAGPALRQIDYTGHFKAAFNIPALDNKGIPFKDEPNLEACITSQSIDGCEIRLYDKSETQPLSERPMLNVDFNTKESGAGCLALTAVRDIPGGHLLLRNLPIIRNFLKELSSTFHVPFSDRVVGGMSHEKSSQIIQESFTEAAREALGDNFRPLDEKLLTQHSQEIGLGGVKTFRDFRGPALRFMIGTGLQASIREKVSVISVWSQKLAEKGVLPTSAAYTLK